MNGIPCFICGEPVFTMPPCWYDRWYDDGMKSICGLACKADLTDMLLADPSKQYSAYKEREAQTPKMLPGAHLGKGDDDGSNT